MRRHINNLLSVIHSFCRMLFLKALYFKGLKFYPVQRLSPSVVFEMNRGSKVFLGKTIRVHSGSKIKIRTGGKLIIGDNVKINYNGVIVCHDEIVIGAGTEFGPAVYIYDHDHDYKIGLNKQEYKTAPVKIGENCWIGANCVLLRGTELGDNCVVAAGSVIKGKYPANCLIYQKRDTRTLIEDKNND